MPHVPATAGRHQTAARAIKTAIDARPIIGGMNNVPLATVDAMMSWIEAHLHEPLDLETVAAKAGYSSFHFSRLFLARTRRSVMAHVRGRRLVHAARRLLAEPDLRLIDLAADCGFDSHEAFTRAFGRMFGVTPSRFRSGFALSPMEGQFPMSAPSTIEASVSRLPDLVDRKAFVVAGPARRFDDASAAEIPQLWSRLMAAEPLPGQSDDRQAYGVVWSVDRREGSFQYLAGVEIASEAPTPAGFERLEIAAARYIVFRIVLDGGPVHEQIKAAMKRIWEDLVPASGLDLAEGPDFEAYDTAKPPTEPGAVIDFHVPVQV